MAEINATLVMKLRGMTGAGMMECKKALTEAKGDVNAAVDVLRKAGAGTTLTLFRVMPACLHLGCVLREIDAKIQPHLLRSSLAEEDRVHERAGDGRTLLRKR